MNRNDAAEKALLGFLSYGALSLCFSSNPLAIGGTAVLGSVLGAAYALLRPLPWRRILLSKSKKACVSVTPSLYFREVSTKAPDRLGFIRVNDLEKKELYEKLKDKCIDPGTIPFHIKVAIEERREIEIPWAVLEPHLKTI